MIEKIDHIGVAVKNIEESMQIYTQILGLKTTHVETVKEQKASVAFIPVGESKIELLESTSPDGPIAKFIEKRGEGVHHIALKVDNLEEKLEKLKQKGVCLVDNKPRIGAKNAKIAFIHPKDTKGVLIELCER